jgi:hypothetical protein
MKLLNSLGRFAADAARAIANHKYEKTEDGQIYLPSARAFIGGVFRHAHAPAGQDFGPWVVDPNRIVNEGLDYILGAALGGQSQVSQFYLAPFSGNVTPGASWTGANFAAQSTEFQAYTATNRLPWNTPGAASAQSLGNTAALADSTLVFNSGGPYNLYGVGLVQASGKGATTGKLIAATRFANPRLNMAGGDKLALEYVISAKDEADA